MSAFDGPTLTHRDEMAILSITAGEISQAWNTLKRVKGTEKIIDLLSEALEEIHTLEAAIGDVRDSKN